MGLICVERRNYEEDNSGSITGFTGDYVFRMRKWWRRGGDDRAPASGSLDTSFGGDGKVTTSIGTGNDDIHSVAMQPDGKVVAAGFLRNGSNFDFAVVRYNPDGSLDDTFHGDGNVTTAISSNDDYGNSVVIQPDGKIVVVGSTYNGANYDFALVRYNSDGTPDLSFDADGIVITPFGSGYDDARQATILPDGKILVGGFSSNGTNIDFALARYNSDGSLDDTFDSDGKVITGIGTSDDYANSMAIQPDGKILLGGSTWNGANYDFALARYNSDGSPDTSFSLDGKLTTAIGTGNDDIHSVTIQPDGKIVVAGFSNNGANDDFALVRYNADGNLDTSFNEDGIVTTDINGSNDYANSVVIQSDSKIIAAGSSWNGANFDFALARYNTDGSLDSTFDADGVIITSIDNGNDDGRAVIINPEGKILVAGNTYNGSNDDFALAVYWP